jgi:tetratricopeptide (TPR) repeat protein
MQVLVFGFVLAALPEGLIDELDKAWATRTTTNYRAVAQTTVRKLKPHAKEFEASWRLARALCWMSERKPDFQDGAYKVRIGKQAMGHALRAIKLQPKRVEGHYYYGWAVGQWSLGISIAKALWKGAEGKLRKSMTQAQRIDRSYDYFGILRMWGRFFHSLPWPKYDGPKALKYLKEANRLTPRNLRGYFYLAESLIKEDQHSKACAVAGKGLAVKPSTTDEPDWKVFKGYLKRLKGAGCKKLLADL